jgi:hypothetical protein
LRSCFRVLGSGRLAAAAPGENAQETDPSSRCHGCVTPSPKLGAN